MAIAKEQDQSWRTDKRSSAARGYGRKWRQARAEFLSINPLCVMCRPRAVPATVVDHKTPHRGDLGLFWNRNNWQPLCKAHHDGAKQSEDRTGHARGCDADGVPIDAAHHWRK